MTISLTVKGGTPRTMPHKGDTGYHGEVSSLMQDIVSALNQTPVDEEVELYEAIVGSSADVTANRATHTDLTSAIAAVSAGDRIYILDGTYTPTSQIDINKQVTIRGQGDAVIIAGDNIAGDSVVVCSSSGCTIEGFKITQGTGTPTYAFEVEAGLERIFFNLRCDGTFSTSRTLISTAAGAVIGFMVSDTNSESHLGETQFLEQLNIEDQTTPAYNLILKSDSDGTVLTANRSLTFDVNNADRVIDLGANLTLSGNNLTVVVEDAASTITLDEQSFEVEGEGTATRLFKLINSSDSARTVSFAADVTFTGLGLTVTVEDAAASLTYDNVHFEVENTDGTQRTIKVTSAKAGDTTLTLQENLTIGDGFDVTITSEDTANSIVLDEQNFEVEGEGTAQQLLKLVNASNAAATLTIDGTSGAVNQDVQSTASPTFVKITRDSNDITVETTTSGDVVLKSAGNNIIVNKADATNASTHTLKFGDDTGGICGIRNNNGALEYNSAGGGWVDTGNLVTLAGTETLTNKTLTNPTINGANQNMGTASNTNRIVVPSDTTTNLDLLTDTAALIAYDTTLSSIVYNNGSGWLELATSSASVIAMRYTTDAGQSITNAVTTDIIFEDLDYDTNSMYNTSTGVATAPEAGKYFCHAAFRYADAAWTAGNAANCIFEVNGTPTAQNVQEFDVTITTSRQWTITAVFDLAQNDTVELTNFHGRTGGAVTLATSGLVNYIEIFKLL